MAILLTLSPYTSRGLVTFYPSVPQHGILTLKLGLNLNIVLAVNCPNIANVLLGDDDPLRRRVFVSSFLPMTMPT